MGAAAVLNLPLEPQPVLSLTDPEITAMYKASPTGTGKVLKFATEYKGWGDIAGAAIQEHMDYEKSLFSGQEKKK